MTNLLGVVGLITFAALGLAFPDKPLTIADVYIAGLLVVLSLEG